MGVGEERPTRSTGAKPDAEPPTGAERNEALVNVIAITEQVGVGVEETGETLQAIRSGHRQHPSCCQRRHAKADDVTDLGIGSSEDDKSCC